MTPQYYAQLGFFNLNPENTAPDKHLDIIHEDGTTGTLIPLEFGWTPTLFREDLPGAYRLGGYTAVPTLRTTATTPMIVRKASVTVFTM